MQDRRFVCLGKTNIIILQEIQLNRKYTTVHIAEQLQPLHLSTILLLTGRLQQPGITKTEILGFI